MRFWTIISLFLAGTLSASAVTCSWYDKPFAGRRTANREIYNPQDLTAASNKHPFGTMLLVSSGGFFVVVRVNDRISKRYGHRIDLSPAAFNQLAPLPQGLVNATVEVLPPL